MKERNLSPASSNVVSLPSRRRFVSASAALAGTALAIPASSSIASSGKASGGRWPAVVNWAQIGEGKAEPATVIRYKIDGFDIASRLGGAKVEWRPGFAASLPVIEALSAGAVDFSFATSTAIIYAVGSGVPIVPLASYRLPSNTVDLLVQPGSGIRSATDLKGKRVADHRGTTGTYSLVRYLEEAGMSLRDIQYVNLMAPDAEAAFANRRVDAWISWQPMMELARRRYEAPALPDVRTYDYAFLVANAKFAERYPEAAAALARSLRDAQIAIEAQPEAMVTQFAKIGGFGSDRMEQDVYLHLLKERRLSWSGIDKLSIVDAPTAEEVQKLAETFHRLGIYPEKVEVARWLVDPRFDAIKEVVASELARPA